MAVVDGVDPGIGDDEISGGRGCRGALSETEVRKAECRGGGQQAGGSCGQDLSFSLPGIRVQMRIVPQIVVPKNRLNCGGTPAAPAYSSTPSTSPGNTSSMSKLLAGMPSTKYCGGQLPRGFLAKRRAERP